VRAIWLLALAACEQASSATPRPALAAPPPHELAVTLERTICYGTCPAYRLAIYRDGVVQFTGEQYVEVSGTALGHVTQADLAALDRAFADARYFELADRYTSYDATDAPSTTTSYQLGARAKQIEHYHGDEHAPAALGELENAIDRIVGSERWIGKTR
jgi:hypothetical protein